MDVPAEIDFDLKEKSRFKINIVKERNIFLIEDYDFVNITPTEAYQQRNGHDP